MDKTSREKDALAQEATKLTALAAKVAGERDKLTTENGKLTAELAKLSVERDRALTAAKKVHFDKTSPGPDSNSGKVRNSLIFARVLNNSPFGVQNAP